MDNLAKLFILYLSYRFIYNRFIFLKKLCIIIKIRYTRLGYAYMNPQDN